MDTGIAVVGALIASSLGSILENFSKLAEILPHCLRTDSERVASVLW